MNHSSRAHFVVPVAIVLGVVTVVLALIFGSPNWDEPETVASEPTILPSAGDETTAPLEAWKRPSTTDPEELAIGYARAIWTYDTAKHGFHDWQNAVSVFADPTGEGPRIARSLMPLFPEWQQLDLRNARATVDGLTAEITPEMKRLQHSAAAPKGWTGFVVRGKQTTVLDNETVVTSRQAAVGVVCTSICKFWSASAQLNP
ncbi:hypothetical protein GCM10009789_65720 [Kribbella sancticallisti]|uniref:Secreted protein n=1 Tax=Kribbella sancticallisti TaxID=460087 RepID=A0ABN2EBH7_9ACTN